MATKIDLEAFEKETQDMREAIRKIANRKRPQGVAAVTTDERLHLTPVRNEFEQLVPTLREMVAKTGVRLPVHDIAQMNESLSVVELLSPLMDDIKDVLRSLEGAVEDTIDKHRSTAFRIFAAYYSSLATAAAEDGDLQAMYEPLTQLFTPKKPAKAQKPEPQPLVANGDKEAPDVKTPVVDKVG